MRKMLIGLALSAMLSFGFMGVVGASYTDAFGNTYTDGQIAQFCAGARPGTQEYLRHCS